jgi:hypothetical protein
VEDGEFVGVGDDLRTTEFSDELARSDDCWGPGGPYRGQAHGVQRGPRVDVHRARRRGGRTRRRRTKDRRRAGTRNEQPQRTPCSRNDATRLRDRHNTPRTFDTANFSWGLCPQTPTFSRFALGFEHRCAMRRTFSKFFPSFTSKNTRPPARNRPPEGRSQRTKLGEFLHFFSKKFHLDSFRKKKF